MERTLAPLIGPSRRITFVGLAKNTGKTEALVALMRELSGAGRRLAITSIGRDGESADAINPRIEKPRIHCPAGTLLATTGYLLARSGANADVLRQTGMKTPLGKVVIGRLREPAAVEVAGPSSAAEIAAVVDEMLDLGADHAIVDGSIDRRAAAAPGVADVVLMSTGAVLGREIEEVVRHTSRAVAMASLPVVDDPRLRQLARRAGNETLLLDGERTVVLPSRFALTGGGRDLPAATARERVLVIGGVLPERLLEALLVNGARPDLKIVAADPTRVFLRTRSPSWYRRRGLRLEVLDRVNLGAITVNPLAPLSHRLDSRRLRAAIAELRPRVPVVDVRDPAYGREPLAAGSAG